MQIYQMLQKKCIESLVMVALLGVLENNYFFLIYLSEFSFKRFLAHHHAATCQEKTQNRKE